jgi:uncharacterized protein (DUF302 family)
MDKLGIEVVLNQPYSVAMDLVKSDLKEQGFGVLTEIDVKATMKAKLDKDFRPYAILGACNPPLAYKALNSLPEIGLLLPCNVTVEYIEESKTLIRFLDPKIMVSLGDLGENEPLVEVAAEARVRLLSVAKSLGSRDID